MQTDDLLHGNCVADVSQQNYDCGTICRRTSDSQTCHTAIVTVAEVVSVCAFGPQRHSKSP